MLLFGDRKSRIEVTIMIWFTGEQTLGKLISKIPELNVEDISSEFICGQCLIRGCLETVKHEASGSSQSINLY